MSLSAKRNTRAFTLLELLMVILVVAVLAALAIPQMQSFAIRAKGAEAMTNLRVLADSALRYKTIYGSFPPLDPWTPGHFPTGKMDASVPTPSKYFRYNYATGGGGGGLFYEFEAWLNGNYDSLPVGALIGYGICIGNTPGADSKGSPYTKFIKVDNNWYLSFYRVEKNATGLYDYLDGWP